MSATGATPSSSGGKKLWIDRVPVMNQAEIWIEVTANDIDAAAQHLRDHAVARRDEIEHLPDGTAAFWIASLAGPLRESSTWFAGN